MQQDQVQQNKDKSHSKKPSSQKHHVSHEEMNKNIAEYTIQILSDPSNSTLTKKFITLELAEKERNVRTAENVGLGQCIYVNFNNVNSKFPYAASADCYCVFCDFFGPLIEYMHGPPQTEACLEPMFGNIDKYNLVDLNAYERDRVIYSEVSIRRNLENIPFAPMMTDSHRKQVVQKLEQIFRKVFQREDEVAEMPVEWEYKFDRIKNDLDDMGAMNNYPNDRLHLVFQNISELSSGVVLNFDDHLQIISSSYDGHIGRLYKKVYDIYTDGNLDTLEYVAHPILGYLTLSPCHIGTGLTIRIIAKFPFLSRMINLENSILKNHDIIVEPENPECLSSGLLLIYNKKTLNKSEEDIFNDIIHAFDVLHKVEHELETTTPMAVQNDTMPVESLERLMDLITKSESRSYTKKYMTAAVINEYDKKKTKFGNTLNHCIRGNAIFPESLYPRTMDSDCYSKFRSFFTPILFEINKIRSTAHASKPTYGVASDNTQHMLTHRDILSYRVRFARNLEQYAFPSAIPSRDREDVERIIVKVFEEFPVEIEGQYVPLGEIRESVFYEDFMHYNLLPELSEVEKSIGCSRNWPNNRGLFFVRKDVKYPEIITVIFVNITEHIKVVCLDPFGKSLHTCYDRAVTILKFLDLRFDNMYARKPGFGFLTCFPQSVGCGLRISAKVYLKNLGDNREVLERKCQTINFVYRGTNGAGSPAMNNVFDLSLKFNMNVTEKWILLTFCQRLKEVLLAEREYDIRIPRPRNDIFFDEESDIDDDSTIVKSDESINETENLDETLENIVGETIPMAN